ncbi:protein-methionine-sulfoxide reductase catalytic subunit MsrP [Sulfurospirillum sp. 1307]|jgi:sulfoxide reductase catalytic subunit YedY
MKDYKKPTWHIKDDEITSEKLFNKRRDFLKLGAATMVSSSLVVEKLSAIESDYRKPLQFSKSDYGKELELTSFDKASTYNNFYEFSTSKKLPAKMAYTLDTTNWMVDISGECENKINIDVDSLIKKFNLEERVYRFRCVEGWSMVVPWIGFPLSELIKMANPNKNAKYVKFTTKVDNDMFPDQKKGIFGAIPYPYVEGLRMDEAMNELAFIAVGMYSKALPKQNGAPMRLVVPWKYGFKSIKSIDKIEFVSDEPKNTWQVVTPKEYGFYANVNPNVDHPRWSQAKERKLGSFFKSKTLMFNGYEKEVGHMYKGMDLRKFY